MNNHHMTISSITPSEKKELHSLGFTPYTGYHVPSFCNPDTKTYWFYTTFFFTGCFLTRISAVKNKMPKLPATIGMVLLAFSTIWDRKKFDIRNNKYLSKDLENNLEMSPMTRNAFEKAMVRNMGFQERLKKEILVLENKLK